MKNLILSVLTFMIVIQYNYGQDNGSSNENKTDFRDKLQFGVKIGVNNSNVYDSKGDAFNTDSKFGLAAGAFVAIPIGKYIGIQPEILFSQRGFKATGNLLGFKYDFTRTTSYIDIPLLFAFKPSEFITVLAGPQYSFLIKREDVFNNSVITSDQVTEIKNTNLRKNTLAFTGGIDINLKHIILGARAGWDLQNNNGDGTSTNPRYKNVWYQGTIGYRFYID
jgi:Outer membrane protein beta-barrel domain